MRRSVVVVLGELERERELEKVAGLRERVGLLRELFGVVDRVTEESRDGEARVRTRSDVSQRDVHVQARAPCPTPEGHLRSGHAEGRREKEKSQLPFSFHLGLCK